MRKALSNLLKKTNNYNSKRKRNGIHKEAGKRKIGYIFFGLVKKKKEALCDSGESTLNFYMNENEERN